MQLITDRLIIRPWVLEDIPHYQAMSRDVGYNCFNAPGVLLVKDDQEAAQKIKDRIKVFEESRIGKFPIFEKETGSFVGTCGGNFFDLNGAKEIELGYRMMLNHWGKGYATESARALLHYLLHDLHQQKVCGFALPQNIQSLKILEKLGFVYQNDFMWAGLMHKFYEIVPKEISPSVHNQNTAH